jgi:hypothetical protein
VDSKEALYCRNWILTRLVSEWKLTSHPLQCQKPEKQRLTFSKWKQKQHISFRHGNSEKDTFKPCYNWEKLEISEHTILKGTSLLWSDLLKYPSLLHRSVMMIYRQLLLRTQVKYVEQLNEKRRGSREMEKRGSFSKHNSTFLWGFGSLYTQYLCVD